MATEALLPQKLREFLRIASKYGADHALSEIVDQSHAARSNSTCAAASTTCHSSQPGPCSFIMESSGDVWRGGETWNDLLRHDRRSRFARAFSFSYNGSDKFLMFRVATEGLHCSSILEELTKIANRPTLSSKWVVPTTEYPSGSYRTPIASHRRIALRSPPSERRNAVADRNKKYRNSGTGRTTAMAETMFSGDRARAGKPTARRLADPRRGDLRPDPDVRRLRRGLDRLVGAVADPCLASRAAGIRARLFVVEHRHHGRRAARWPHRRPVWPQAAADDERDAVRYRLAG